LKAVYTAQNTIPNADDYIANSFTVLVLKKSRHTCHARLSSRQRFKNYIRTHRNLYL